MLLSDISVRRPVFAAVMSLILILVGLMALSRLAVREYPNIDSPTVSVDVTYRGAAADIIETKITRVIENQLAGIEGLDKITSSSQDERSRITLEFTVGTDIEAAANDVRDRISRVQAMLPLEADAPQISKVDSRGDSIMNISFSSDARPPGELTDYVNRFVLDRIAVVPGVATVQTIGAQKYAMRIWLDRRALAARGLTVQDIENTLRAENVQLPAGRLESQEREFTLRTDTGMLSEADFRNLVIGRGSDGYLVRLNEVARVAIGAEDERSIARSSGINIVMVSVTPTSTANVLDVGNGVHKVIDQLRATLPSDIKLIIGVDNTLVVSESIHEVLVTLAIAIALVLVVIYAFLGSMRATIIPAVTIPISIISACMVMAVAGFSINVLTLLGAVLAIGLVVDDAIVVMENIVRRIELGAAPLLAAIDGSREIAFAVIATTLALIAVFLPISFIPGNIGRLFGEFGISVAAAILFSGLIALSLTPMMASKVFAKGIERGRFALFVDRRFRALANVYERSLRAVTRHPWWVAGLALIVTVMGYSIFMQLPSEYAPADDRNRIFLMVTAPEGSSLSYVDRYVRRVEAIANDQIKKGTTERVVTRVAGGGDAINSGRVIMVLKARNERDESAQQIANHLRGPANQLAGVRIAVITPAGLGGRGAGQPVQFVLGGPSYEELAKWRDIIMARAADNPGLLNVDSDYDERKPQLRVSIDRQRAADMGVSLESVGRTLETMLGSRVVTTYVERGEEYNVMLQAKSEDRATPTDLDNIYVRSDRTKGLIPLSNLVHVEEVAGAAKLNRFNRLRSVTISAGLADGYSIGDALKFLETTVRSELPSDAQIDYDGQSREFRKAGSALYLMFALAIAIVYLVLAAQFESFRHPAIIMTTVPLAVAGAVLGLWVQGSSINVFSQIGAVMLIGLAAKNGILIVEFANQLRDEGMEFIESIIKASTTRLRPVLMTSLCTVFGAMPLLLASGAGSEARRPIGAVIVFGVTLSLVLTLYVVPSFYVLVARTTRSPQYLAKIIDKLRGTASKPADPAEQSH